jgi:hypothetical protein
VEYYSKGSGWSKDGKLDPNNPHSRNRTDISRKVWN